jgi:hypothetical protein
LLLRYRKTGPKKALPKKRFSIPAA